MKLIITEPTSSGRQFFAGQTRSWIRRAMRIGLIYFVVACTSAQLLLANPVVSQELSEQTVTLGFKNQSLKTILRKIEEKSSFSFIIPVDEVETYNDISVATQKRSVKETLDLVLRETKLSYRQINDKTVLIFLSKNKVTIRPDQLEDAQPEVIEKSLDINLAGRVTDEKGEGLPGVSIVVKGTSVGTVTSVSGDYAISVPDEKAVLTFSYVGYLSQEIEVGNRNRVDISLKPDTKALEEVIVVGYGTAKKRDITGAVARADLNAFKESPNVSILQSLQGSVPGLNVGATTLAGQDPDISIRGRNSISGGTAPLIVLDGIIYRGSIVDINPNDVASIDVLKDASAAAVYGSQASNGVILITSKVGKATKKPTIEYSTSFSLQEITNKAMLPDDGAGYLRKKADRYLSLSRTGPGLLTKNPDFDPSKYVISQVLEGMQKGTETNWWNLLTNKRPSIQNHDISISGKSELSSYFFSLGYTNQQNVVKNDNYKRYNFRINLDTKVTSWMKVGIQSFLGISNYSGAAPSLDDVLYMIPQLDYKDATGAYIKLPDGARVNPFLQIQQENKDLRNNLFGVIYTDINVPFIKGLSYRLNFSQNLINYKWDNYNPNALNFTGEAYKIDSTQYAQTLDNIITYQRDFGKHSFTGTLLYGFERRQLDGTTARSQVFANGILGYNKLDAGQASLQSTTSKAWKEASLYSMARLIYSYNDKYIFTGTVRRDGFSGFGSNNKFGVFPSLAAAWYISEEKFIKDNVTFLDDLKLRASYGINGNRTIGRYQTQAKIAASVANGYLYGDGGAAVQGQSMNALANGNLKWESTRSLNFGADFALFKNRVSGSINTYVSNTYYLLFNVDLPVLNGFASSPANIGKLKNTGQELTLGGRPVQKGDFSWDVSVNFSRNRNKVVSILGIDANKDGKEDDLVSSKIFINHPYGVAYDFNITGMWQVADAEAGTIPAGFTYGTYKVEDINQDKAYTAAADRKILGYTDPSYRFSIMNNFRYKAWEFSFFINSIQGGKKYYYGQPGANLPNPDNISNGNIFNFDYWTPENPGARYRQLGYYTVALGETFSPYIQRNFVRLQNVTLSYNLPRPLLKKIGMNRVKLFLNGKNLLTFSDWDGWDPETGTGLNRASFPLLRSYTVGLNIEF
jgi:TonB-dependent starch-binding outer membrane protein SusC